MAVSLSNPIPFVLGQDFYTGPSHLLSTLFIKAGEQCYVDQVIMPHASNPLYSVRNSQGKTQAIYRDELCYKGVTFHNL